MMLLRHIMQKYHLCKDSNFNKHSLKKGNCSNVLFFYSLKTVSSSGRCLLDELYFYKFYLGLKDKQKN